MPFKSSSFIFHGVCGLWTGSGTVRCDLLCPTNGLSGVASHSFFGHECGSDILSSAAKGGSFVSGSSFSSGTRLVNSRGIHGLFFVCSASLRFGKSLSLERVYFDVRLVGLFYRVSMRSASRFRLWWTGFLVVCPYSLVTFFTGSLILMSVYKGRSR